MNDVQATGEVSSPQKETPSTSEQYIFLFLWIIFDHLDQDPDPADQIEWVDTALDFRKHKPQAHLKKS